MNFQVLILSIIFLTVINYAEKRPFTSKGDIKYYADYAGFQGENRGTIQEFYISIFTDQLEKIKSDSNSVSRINLSTSIKDNFGENFYSKSWQIEIKHPQNDSLSKDQVVYEQWSLRLLPGEYNLFIELEDMKSRKRGEIKNSINVRNYDFPNFGVSDIEFATGYSKDGSPQFKKGQLYIKPNPWRRYGVLNPLLYFYFELYNLQNNKNDFINLTYSIVNQDGRKFRSLRTQKQNTHNSLSIFDGFDVSNIPSGIYSLIIEIDSLSQQQAKIALEQFEIIQPDYAHLVSNMNNVFEILDKISVYLMNPGEWDRYQKLEENKKFSYLENYFRKDNPNSTSDYNKYVESILSRYFFVEDNYKWGNINGWKTDRGRIVIVYGIPDEINRNVFEESTLPYEIWKYQKDREFEFVFGDLRADGRYVLLHSTKEDEIYNPSWFREIKK